MTPSCQILWNKNIDIDMIVENVQISETLKPRR